MIGMIYSFDQGMFHRMFNFSERNAGASFPTIVMVFAVDNGKIRRIYFHIFRSDKQKSRDRRGM